MNDNNVRIVIGTDEPRVFVGDIEMVGLCQVELMVDADTAEMFARIVLTPESVVRNDYQ